MLLILFVLLIVVSLVMTYFFIAERNKNIKIKNVVFSNKRTGTYEVSYGIDGNFNMLVKFFIDEVEKYKNGTSKIKLDHIEIVKSPINSRNALIEKAQKEFSSIRKSNDIDWLEIDESVKSIRRKKLKEIMNINK